MTTGRITTSVFALMTLILFSTSCSKGGETEVPPMVTEPEEIDEPIVVDPPTATDNIVWENWYLSVPIEANNGKATSIGYEDIINDNLTTEESNYFYKNDDDTYTMWTKFTGFTTSGLSELGDKYCRTELREYWQGNQDTNDNWSMATGIHILESTLNVDFVEGNGRTIVAQIHGKESAVSMGVQRQ